MMSNDLSDVDIPEGWRETMENNNWSDEEIAAWKTLHDAREGDYVLWADRTVAMRVAEVDQDEDGQHTLYAEKPAADGTYEVEETYNNGKLKMTSPIGRANNLHFTERTDPPRGLTEDEFDSLVTRLSENAVDSFLRLDYDDWPGAVEDVVESWSEDVSLRDWRGYKHHPDWEDGDPEAIYRSAIEHADGHEYWEEHHLTIREQAEVALHDRVYQDGRERAEESIIEDGPDYWDTVETLAHHSVDRHERKSYTDARTAVRDTISDWIDDRTTVVYERIIEYGTQRYDDDAYVDESVENPVRERAFDIISQDVWEEVQRIQRSRGEHDPTLRGMTYETYQETVDALVEDTLAQYRGVGFFRTTVKEIVEDWADEVEAEQWGGHRHRVYGAGDVEDIFSSAAIHSSANPFLWNPFSDARERKMATQALTADVVDRAENALDENQPSAYPVPADEYIDSHLDLDGVSYDDFKDAHPEDVDATVERILDALEGDEVGWTFVDEIVESGGTVPEATNDWVLADYGIIREGETIRKLAWFDRDSGDVLVLSGQATAPPSELEDTESPYDVFHVSLVSYMDDEPDHLLTEASLDESLDYVYDYIGADRADMRIINDTDGDTLVESTITDEDINAGGVLDSLIPNIQWGSDDLITLADTNSRALGDTLSTWGPELGKMTAYAVLAWAPKWAGDRLDGVRVTPNVDKNHGVGTNVSKEFGASPYESGVGGKAKIDINVRPKTFRNLGEKYAPKFLEQGFGEGDLGKGVVSSAGEQLDNVRDNPWGKAFVEEFGDSIVSLERTLAKGGRDARVEDEPFKVFLENEGEVDYDDLPFDPNDDEEVREYIRENNHNVDFSWDDFERQDLGISGMLMRGLDASRLVSTAEFLNVDDWLDETFTFYGSDYVQGGDPPSFEEWEEERFGPGKPAGPEEEARRLARYHKEVAASDEEVDPHEAMGVDEEDAQGDYNNAQYDFDDTFGNNFDEVADRYSSDEPADDANASDITTK